jgi:hypothetical protein
MQHNESADGSVMVLRSETSKSGRPGAFASPYNEGNCCMVSCPKCGHMRQPKDDGFVPGNECPKCGIVYAKFAEMEKPPNGGRSAMPGSRDAGRHSSTWNILVWCAIISIMIIAWKNIDTTNRNINTKTIENDDTTGSPTISASGSIPQEKRSDRSSYGSLDNLTTWRALTPLTNNGSKELSNIIGRLRNAYDQPLNDSYLYHNQLMPYQWDFIKSASNYVKIQTILYNYHQQHTYMGNDLFVCVDMTMEVWNLLATAGIRSKLMAGNVQTDITNGSTFRNYLAGMNHAWVLAEVSPALWIPLETTGGYIVDPSMQNFHLYNMGVMFENPKEFKEFSVSRKAMFDTWNDMASMVDHYNRLYAEKPMTTEAVEYTGRMKQKLEDCEHLIAGVTVSLQRR